LKPESAGTHDMRGYNDPRGTSSHRVPSKVTAALGLEQLVQGLYLAITLDIRDIAEHRIPLCRMEAVLEKREQE